MSSLEMIIVLPLILLYVFSGLVLCVSAWGFFLFNISVGRAASEVAQKYAIIARGQTSDDGARRESMKALMEQLPQAICDGVYGWSSCDESSDVCLVSVSLAGEEPPLWGCFSEGGSDALVDALPLVCEREGGDGGRLGLLVVQVRVPVWWLFFPQSWRIQARSPFLVAC